MKLLVMLLLAAGTAQAATIGESSFTMWTSQGAVATDIRETDKGEILGRTGFGTVGMINLKITTNGFKGQSDDGFTDIRCSATKCEGTVGSGTVNIQIKDNGQVLEGSLNHVRVYAKLKDGKIRISADGTIEVNQTKPGRYFGRGMVEPNYISDVQIKTSGTLTNRLTNDPAFFIVYLVAPLVRNGIF